MTAIIENRKLKVSGPLPDTKMYIKAARVIEGLSKITETTVDFMSHDRDIDLGILVGQTHTVKIAKGEQEGGSWREFVGTCIQAEFLGLHEGYSFFTLEVRPWIWFLTKTSNNRIFQNLSAVDIIKKVFSDRNFADYTFNVNRSPTPRVYTVQYNETDYAFICRLMEEEGFYFYSKVQSSKDHLMIVDNIGGHSPVENAASIEFVVREENFRRTTDHIFEWRGGESVRSGKVTLRDYKFETPVADKTTVKAIPKGQHNHKNYEQYIYSGRYREPARVLSLK